MKRARIIVTLMPPTDLSVTLEAPIAGRIVKPIDWRTQPTQYDLITKLAVVISEIARGTAVAAVDVDNVQELYQRTQRRSNGSE